MPVKRYLQVGGYRCRWNTTGGISSTSRKLQISVDVWLQVGQDRARVLFAGVVKSVICDVDKAPQLFLVVGRHPPKERRQGVREKVTQTLGLMVLRE